MSVSGETLRAIQRENASLKEEIRLLREELTHLRQAIGALKDLERSLDTITPESDVFSLLKNLLSRALDAVNSADGSLMLLDEETSELVFVEVQGSNQEALTGYRLPAGAGIAGWVATHRTPELVADVRQDSRFYPMVDQALGFHTTSLICAPLIYQNQVLGAIEAVNTRSGEPFHKDDLDILLLVARLTSEALALAEQ